MPECSHISTPCSDRINGEWEELQLNRLRRHPRIAQGQSLRAVKSDAGCEENLSVRLISPALPSSARSRHDPPLSSRSRAIALPRSGHHCLCAGSHGSQGTDEKHKEVVTRLLEGLEQHSPSLPSDKSSSLDSESSGRGLNVGE